MPETKFLNSVDEVYAALEAGSKVQFTACNPNQEPGWISYKETNKGAVNSLFRQFPNGFRVVLSEESNMAKETSLISIAGETPIKIEQGSTILQITFDDDRQVRIQHRHEEMVIKQYDDMVQLMLPNHAINNVDITHYNDEVPPGLEKEWPEKVRPRTYTWAVLTISNAKHTSRYYWYSEGREELSTFEHRAAKKPAPEKA